MIDSIVEELSNLTVMETVELTKKLEKKWNISAIDNSSAKKNTNERPAESKTKSVYDIHLKSVGLKRIRVISIVREFLKSSLKDAKEKIDLVPTIIKSSVAKEDAEKLKKKIEMEGAKIELK
jgi:large subunit ribosomal protein L7/L12